MFGSFDLTDSIVLKEQDSPSKKEVRLFLSDFTVLADLDSMTYKAIQEYNKSPVETVIGFLLSNENSCVIGADFFLHLKMRDCCLYVTARSYKKETVASIIKDQSGIIAADPKHFSLIYEEWKEEIKQLVRKKYFKFLALNPEKTAIIYPELKESVLRIFWQHQVS